jgi:uncharacterized RDD family membrane protein YckC
MDNRYIIDTPENIEFGYDIAGIGSRFLAAIIDTVLIGIAEIIILLVVGLAVQSLSLAESVLTAAGALLGFVVLWGYYVAFELAWNGQSPGKRLLGLRVVREGGRPITAIASIIRNLIRLVDFLPLLYGIGVVAMFVDRRSRRLGDLAAGVLVVRERAEVTLESLTIRPLALQQAPINGINGILLPTIAALNETDYALVQDFLAQRNDLARETRLRLALQLVRGLEQRMAVQAGMQPEPFLEQVAASYRAQRNQEQEREGTSEGTSEQEGEGTREQSGEGTSEQSSVQEG